MRIFYDTEFLENGSVIQLISIGMVREDGEELYRVNRAAPLVQVAKHGWLLEHVVPSLPVSLSEAGELTWNTLHPDYPCLAGPGNIAHDVRDFVLGVEEPELWAWYGAYDHVVVCQLFGRMVDLPKGFPMWTNDLKQEVARVEQLGKPVTLPTLDGGAEHNALHDARELRYRATWLHNYELGANEDLA